MISTAIQVRCVGNSGCREILNLLFFMAGVIMGAVTLKYQMQRAILFHKGEKYLVSF